MSPQGRRRPVSAIARAGDGARAQQATTSPHTHGTEQQREQQPAVQTAVGHSASGGARPPSNRRATPTNDAPAHYDEYGIAIDNGDDDIDDRFDDVPTVRNRVPRRTVRGGRGGDVGQGDVPAEQQQQQQLEGLSDGFFDEGGQFQSGKPVTMAPAPVPLRARPISASQAHAAARLSSGRPSSAVVVGRATDAAVMRTLNAGTAALSSTAISRAIEEAVANVRRRGWR